RRRAERDQRAVVATSRRGCGTLRPREAATEYDKNFAWEAIFAGAIFLPPTFFVVFGSGRAAQPVGPCGAPPAPGYIESGGSAPASGERSAASACSTRSGPAFRRIDAIRACAYCT